MSILNTISNDFRILSMCFKIAFTPTDRNPLYLAEIEKYKREDEKKREIEEKTEQLKKLYKKGLSDFCSKDEVEEQMLISSEFLKQRAKVLSYDFWPCEKTHKSELENRVDEAKESIYDKWFMVRTIMYAALTGLAIAEIIHYFFM